MEGENLHGTKDTHDSVHYESAFFLNMAFDTETTAHASWGIFIHILIIRSQLCHPHLQLAGVIRVLKLVPVDARRLALLPHALHQVFGHGPRLRISFLLALIALLAVVVVAQARDSHQTNRRPRSSARTRESNDAVQQSPRGILHYQKMPPQGPRKLLY